MSANAVALVIQLFIAARVLQRAGAIFSLTLLPSYFSSRVQRPFILGGMLTAALLTKGADGALRHSLHKVFTELLFLPLGAADRASAKGFVDALVTRGSQGIGALVLLGLTTLSWDQPRILFGIICGGASLWIGTALSLRRPYLDQFRQSIGRNRGNPDFDLNQLTLDSVEVVIESLSSPDENRVLSAMTLFERAGRTGLIPALLLYHPQERILLRSLELIPSDERKDWPPLAARLMKNDSEAVRLAAVRALGRFDQLDKIDHDSFQHPRVSATAAFFQADRLETPSHHDHIRHLTEPGQTPEHKRHFSKQSPNTVRGAGATFCWKFSNAPIPELANLLPRAMNRVRDRRFIPTLIERLAIRDGSEEVRSALAAIGSDAFDALCEALVATYDFSGSSSANPCEPLPALTIKRRLSF